MLGLYFTFAVQGDYGLFRRAEIISDAQKLEAELAMLQNELSECTRDFKAHLMNIWI